VCLLAVQHSITEQAGSNGDEYKYYSEGVRVLISAGTPSVLRSCVVPSSSPSNALEILPITSSPFPFSSFPIDCFPFDRVYSEPVSRQRQESFLISDVSRTAVGFTNPHNEQEPIFLIQPRLKIGGAISPLPMRLHVVNKDCCAFTVVVAK
jgi:hypothetical protein